MTEESREHDDEVLSAYLDGELPRAEADEVTRRLAREPALAERLEALRAMDALTAEAFHALDERPMPARVLDLLRDPDEPGSNASNVVSLRRLRVPARFFQLPVAVAASIALAGGIWLGALLENGGGLPGAVPDGRIVAGSPLYAAFERGVSGAAVPLEGDSMAESVLTFRSADGAWCREVRITGGSMPADTLACRREGAWQVELVSFGPAATAPGEGPYGQAADGATAAMRAAIGDLIGKEPPLAPAEEAAAIERGWE